MTCFFYLKQAKVINSSENVNRLLLAHLLKKDIFWLYAHFDYDIDHIVTITKYLELVKKYVNGYPLAYIIGYVFFLGYKIKVNHNVLIPRNETEDLVERTISYCETYFMTTKIKVLDLGTGSGCIAISLAYEFPQAKITASDISQTALEVAKINLQYHHDCNNVKLVKSDCFNNLRTKKFDLIIVNPPYINQASTTYNKIHLQHEPSTALFAKNQGLAIYEKIFKNFLAHVNKKFFLALEIGFDQKESLTKMLQQLSLDCDWWYEKDLEGNWRFLFLKGQL